MLLACGPQANAQSALEAAALANRACRISDRKNPMHLDALAAALARNGEFPQAVKTAEKAVQMAAGAPEEPAYRARLELYKVQKPYRLPTE
jgi:hypothetical protein